MYSVASKLGVEDQDHRKTYFVYHIYDFYILILRNVRCSVKIRGGGPRSQEENLSKKSGQTSQERKFLLGKTVSKGMRVGKEFCKWD